MFENQSHQNAPFQMRVNFNLKEISNVGGKRSQIWINTTIDGKRVRIYTRQLVNKEYWIKSNRSDIGGGQAKEDSSLDRVTARENKRINKELKKILGYIQDYTNLVTSSHLQTRENEIQHSPDNFKRYIEARITGNVEERKATAEEFIQKYIEWKEQSVNKHTGRTLSKGTIYNHRNALQRLQKYAAEKHINITWRLFTEDFEHDFTAWLNEQDFTPNTISSQYSIIKVWLKEAEKKGLMEDKSFHHYHTATHDVENIYLTEEELRLLYNLDLSNEETNTQSKYEETRDLFIVGCWTGLRYSDYASLPKISEETTTIKLRCHKTNRSVVIPLHPMVKEIYRKYNGKLPKPIDRGAALKNIRRCAKMAGINSSVTLRSTHGGTTEDVVGEKWQFIMNHTARRSFATNMYLKRVPTISIMSVTGHTTESNFMKYIKVDGEIHAQIVAEAFNQEVPA